MAKTHFIKRRSLVAWFCNCGSHWQNHRLAKKSDDDLVAENASEFAKHVVAARAARD